jgi:guanine deaminase
MAFQPNSQFMRAAILAAEENLKTGKGGPFGACIVKNNEILAVAHNTVLLEDATCHAEMNAIRMASKKLNTWDLSGCEIYSTTEPCPMCFSAIHWANIGKIIYGTTIRNVQQLGFNELSISNHQMRILGKTTLKLYPHFLRQECQQLLEQWKRCEYRQSY